MAGIKPGDSVHRRRIGIFGGTFDPPHVGHLILAEESYAQLGLDLVLWVLTPHPPHKVRRKITPTSDRLEMVQKAIMGNPAFEISRADIDRPPPHYALDTVRAIRKRNTDAELIYLMGSDSLADLPDWHDPRMFVQVCDAIGIMCRPGGLIDLQDLEAEIPGLESKVCFIQAPLLEISSSRLRLRIRQGLAFRYYLPSPVYEFIQHRNLYRE
jgi:nicotinate-nucleotide adenylyltransferase